MRNNVTLDQFLEEYKAFERAVCGSDKLAALPWIANCSESVDSVFSLENFITDQEIKDKVKLCRMIRNYAQHHPDAKEFLSVSAEEINLLHSLTEQVNCLEGVAKDIMTRCTVTLTERNTIADFAQAMSSKHLSVYPYTNKLGEIAVLSQEDIIEALGSGSTAKQKVASAIQEKNKIHLEFVFQNTPITQLPSANVIIVLTQTKKAIGVILEKDR